MRTAHALHHFFHWAIVLLIALAYLAIEIRGPKGSDSRVFLSNVHFLAGNLVLALAVLRLLWRLWAGALDEIDSNRVLAFLARAAHLAPTFSSSRNPFSAF